MKRWVVRTAERVIGMAREWSEVVVVADRIELSEGVAAFYKDPPPSRTAIFREDLKLVRAFGVGQWRDIEPLASPPEETPDPEAGVIREPGDGCRVCGHRRWEHGTGNLTTCQVHHCICEAFR